MNPQADQRGPVSDHPLVTAAYRARDRVLAADADWARDLENLALAGAYRQARRELREANAAARGRPSVCCRCGGTRRIPEYSHVADGVCFTCDGAGSLPFTRASARLAPDQRARKAAARAEQAHAREQDARERRVVFARRLPLAAAAVITVAVPARPQDAWDQVLGLDDEQATLYAARMLSDHHRDLRWPTRRAGRGERCGVCERRLEPFEYGRYDSFARRGGQAAPTVHEDCVGHPLPLDADAAAAARYLHAELGARAADDLYRALGVT